MKLLKRSRYRPTLSNIIVTDNYQILIKASNKAGSFNFFKLLSMPLTYLNCPVDIFDFIAKNAMAEELTATAFKIENLPDTAFVYIMEMLTTLFRAKLTTGLADF